MNESIVISATNTKDPEPLNSLQEFLTVRMDAEQLARRTLPGEKHEQGLVEVIAVSIAAAGFLLELIKALVEWRKAFKAEQEQEVDLRIECADFVVEIKSK